MSVPMEQIVKPQTTAIKRKRIDSNEEEIPTPVSKKSTNPPSPTYPISSPSGLPIISLTEDQKKAVDAALQGHNVYIGGVSGSGKSSIIRIICDGLQEKGKSVGVLAFTGLAAALVQGSTIHYFLGINSSLKPDTDKSKLWRSVKKNVPAVTRMITTNTFIFDELSYISSYSYCIYEFLVRNAKNDTNGKPWGGAQVVFLGDFKQLPPIGDYNKRETPWLFLSSEWRDHITHYFHLRTVLRQTDPALIAALNELREGDVSDKTDAFFHRIAAQPPLQGPVTHIFATKRAVDRHNEGEMSRLPCKETTYLAKTTYHDPDSAELSTLVVPEKIGIKKGATVMLTRNVDLEEELVNGTLGVVQGFCRGSTWMEFYSEQELDTELELPVILSEGADEVHLGGPGDPLFPVVKWTPPGSSVPKEYPQIVRPHTFKMTDSNGKPIISVVQLPIVLAYAMTFHKAQGQTLTSCVVHLEDNIFHPSMVYVGLSRCIWSSQMRIIGWNRDIVHLDHKVAWWFKHLLPGLLSTGAKVLNTGKPDGIKQKGKIEMKERSITFYFPKRE